MKIRLGVVDDNPLLIRSVVERLKNHNVIDCIFTVSNGKQLINHLEHEVPDILLMDLQMPEMDGIEATTVVKEKHPSVKVIILSVLDDEDKIFKAIQAGANGYLLKEGSSENLINGILEIMDGGAPMSPSIANKALKILREAKFETPKQKEDIELTNRETEVLEELCHGFYIKEIADNLFISAGTVRKHIENNYQKLEVHNKVEAVQKANRMNLFGN